MPKMKCANEFWRRGHFRLMDSTFQRSKQSRHLILCDNFGTEGQLFPVMCAIMSSILNWVDDTVWAYSRKCIANGFIPIWICIKIGWNIRIGPTCVCINFCHALITFQLKCAPPTNGLCWGLNYLRVHHICLCRNVKNFHIHEFTVCTILVCIPLFLTSTTWWAVIYWITC